MYPYIVADIGGTNARFALVTGKKGNAFNLEQIQILNGSEFPRLQDAMQHYINTLGGEKPKAACVAIAGPIDGDNARMTNLNWEFSQAAVKAEFGFDKYDTLNDFGALAVATSSLQADNLIEIKAGTMDPKGNKAILGPGTGLGVAGLACAGDSWLPIPSEGGHVNVAPATQLECEVIRAAMAEHGHVSAETFISGPGLVRLYRALATVRGETPKNYEPKDITAGALDGTDDLCKETLDLFCSFIGSLSGNLALTYGAKGGVYLAGGVLPRFIDYFKSSDFVKRFSEKGVMSHYVENIPVNLISYEYTAFVGAAAWLDQL